MEALLAERPSVNPQTGSTVCADAELAQHRSAMLRFARRKIRDEDLAEDAVQDALAAALSSQARFEGRSALRTWLIGILNHKIQDVFRKESRYVHPFRSEDGESDAVSDADRLLESGLHDGPAPDDPLYLVSQRRLSEGLMREVEQLPATLRDVFVMQVVDGLSTQQVCERLGISEANCWVRLHRARKRLAERMRDHLD